MIIVNKQYIRIVDHLEKEVQIYDTINEKKIFNIFFNELDSAICLNGALTDTVDLLNDLSEENDVLKQQLSEQGTQIDFLKDENTHMKCVLNRNKQLKQELDYIQNSITEHIKHQKTELGQKALKEIIKDYNEWLLGHKELQE